MAKLVGALALSHGSSIVSEPQRVSPVVGREVYGALDHARERLAGMRADAIVIIGTDHFNTFFVDDLPLACVGVGDSYAGWADNMPMYTAKGSVAASSELLSALPRGTRREPNMRLDHSFMGPLHFLTPDMSIPLVPIFQNCIAEPMPSLDASLQLGRDLAAGIEAISEWDRVVLIGSGGLSHWLGGPQHTRVDASFDQQFLEAFTRDELDRYSVMPSAQLEQLAGNGGHEIRNWLTVRGCADGEKFDVDVVYYRPITEWMVGFAVTVLDPTAAS